MSLSFPVTFGLRLATARSVLDREVRLTTFLAGWLLASSANPLPAQSGERLETALHRLRAQGLELVYSSRLVRPNLKVSKPATGSPEDQLEQLLRPHGLTALKTESGTYLVIAATGSDAEPMVLTGRIYSAHTGTSLSGATVRILSFRPAQEPPQGKSNAASVGQQQTTGALGNFRFTALSPGIYELEASRDDHVAASRTVLLQAVPATRGRVAAEPPAHIALQPRAFLNEEIAVRASETSLLKETDGSSLSLNRTEVQQLPRLGSDVFRALSILPGVVSTDISAQPRIRGGRLDELQLLLDGQEIYGGYHLQDYDNGLSAIATDDLAQVEVVTGNLSAEMGDRMGGVLDLRTRTPNQALGRITLSAVHLEGSYGGLFQRDRGSWQITGRRGSAEIVQRLFGEENPSFWDVLAKVDLQLGRRQRVRGTGLLAGDHVDFIEAVGVGSEREVDQLDSRYRNDQFWLTHQALIGERVVVVSAVAHSNLQQRRGGSEIAEEQVFELSDRRSLRIDEARQQWLFQIHPNHGLKIGAAWRSYSSTFQYFSSFDRELTSVGDEVLPSAPPANFAGDYSGEHYSSHITDRLRLGQRWSLEAGLRWDRYGQGLQPQGSRSVWSPRVAAAFQLTPRTVVRAGWGQHYQSQRPYEISVEDGLTEPSRLERSNQSLVGIEHQFSDQAMLKALRFEIFRRRISEPRVRFINAFEPFNVLRELEPDRIGVAPERSRADGVELVVRGTAGSRIAWWLNYSYSRSQDLLQGTGGSRRFVDRETDQPHAASLATTFQLPRSWQLSVATRFHSGWPTTPTSLGAVNSDRARTGTETSDGDDEREQGLLILGPLNSRRLSNYFRLDLRLSKTWRLSRGELLFFIDLQNATDRENVSGLDHAIEDGVQETSLERWPGIFPSLGVRWSF